MRYAIMTEFFHPTISFGARIKAKCVLGDCTEMWDDELTPEDNHRKACKALQSKMANFNPEDAWMREMIGGIMPNKTDYVFVFAEDQK